MSATPPSPRNTQRLARYPVELLTALALLFVLLAGLMPLDFLRRTAGEGAIVFFVTKPHDLILPDVVSNILLYFPLGALLAWTLDRRVGNAVLAGGAAVILSAALSFAVEYAQAYSPSRVSSLIDLVSNVTGAALGAALSWAVRSIVPRLFDAALFELHHRPQAAVAKAYCVALVLFAAVPFSFSFDVARLKKTVKSANLVPFARHPHTAFSFLGRPLAPKMSAPSARRNERAGADFVPPNAAPDGPTNSTVADPVRSEAYRRWFRAKQWSRWGAEAVSFLVLGALLVPLLRDDYGFTRRAAVALVLWLGVILAVGLTIVQLFILSRVCDATDVVMRFAGLLPGLALGERLVRSGRITGPQPQQRHEGRRQALARFGCAACAAYILYNGVIPFSFDWRLDRAASALTVPEFLPFYSYFIARFDLMIADVTEKCTAYALLAALLVACRPDRLRLPTRDRIALAACVALPISLFIEMLQMFNPVRVTSLTDPIVAVVGCAVGVVLHERAVRFYRLARTIELPEPARVLHRRAAGPVLTPADELIAALSEPREGAPAEPQPARPKRPAPRD